MGLSFLRLFYRELNTHDDDDDGDENVSKKTQ